MSSQMESKPSISVTPTTKTTVHNHTADNHARPPRGGRAFVLPANSRFRHGIAKCALAAANATSHLVFCLCVVCMSQLRCTPGTYARIAIWLGMCASPGQGPPSAHLCPAWMTGPPPSKGGVRRAKLVDFRWMRKGRAHLLLEKFQQAHSCRASVTGMDYALQICRS